MVDTGRIPHAILISGPQGVGKMKIARALAQYIHCRNHVDNDSCGKCSSCIQHSSFNNPDLHFVYPIIKKAKREVSKDYYPEWREFLKSDQYMSPEKWQLFIDAGNSQPAIYVAESIDILRIASLSPFIGEKKVFIIWQPEKMNPEVANKLLKIIEEPFEDTIFIFVSNNPGLILPTVYSRLTRINVHRLSDEVIIEQLVRNGIPEDMAREISRLSEGNIGKAIEMSSSSGESREFHDMFIEIMRTAYSRNIVKLREISESIAGYGREKTRRFLSYCSKMIRENFIYNYQIPALNLMDPSQEAFSKKFSPFINSLNVENLAVEMGKAETDIARNANAKIVIFHLLLIIMMEIRRK